jgi:hypothetical protein
MQPLRFNEALHKKSQKELSSKKAIEIINKYNAKLKTKYPSNFLLQYYSPTYSILKKLLNKFEHKNILEIGFRAPLFLDFLQSKGANTYGVDIKPDIINENLVKMSIEKLSKGYLSKNKNKFHAIVARITLSRLYDEKHEVETGKPMFKDKRKILSNIFQLLKPKGILILQDDRGSIFSEKQFKDIGLKKIVNEYPITFTENGKSLGWNVIVAYRK